MSMDKDITADVSPAAREVGGRTSSAQILRERANALAREPLSRSDPEESLEIVEFQLADERYGIESIWVREVFPLRELTPLPCTPPFVLGILNVRGQIRTVIDIRRFFDLPFKGLTDLNKVIFLESDQMEIGIMADVIIGVRAIARSELQPSLPTLMGVRGEYLRGVTKDRVAILDAAKILSDKKLIVHEEVVA